MIFICEYLQFRKLRIKLESKLYKERRKTWSKSFSEWDGSDVSISYFDFGDYYVRGSAEIVLWI